MSKPAKGDRRVAWIDQGWQPAYLGFAPSKRAWDRQMKEMGCSMEYPTEPGRCSIFDQTKAGGCVILMTFNRKRLTAATPIQRVGLVAHECVHMWQFIRRNAGIQEPDMETEAYSVMALTQNILRCLDQCWGMNLRWRDKRV